ncbi:MAG: right-handed parallel beta-helix repeat-containing protein [Planctomycetota bacterium]|jgi:parallel beta-helix repeat protein
MFFRKAKPFSSVTRKSPDNKHRPGGPKVCPKTGKFIGRSSKHWWLIWLFPIAGLLSLIWFLIRVLPKPSRATYPCQRFAAPLASGFVVWLTGLIGSTLAYRKAKQTFHQSRYVVAAICVAVSVMAIWWSINVTGEPPTEAAFTPTEPPNSPMGVAKGIYPGRVVWTHEPAATSWDGSTGHWWDDAHTDQNVVDYMVSKTLQKLTGQSSDPNVWDALFRHFNQTTSRGDGSYQRGEQIVIKINMNQDSGSTWGKGRGHPSPHVIYSVLNQLINVAGVPGSAITIYDASRYIGDPIFDKIRSNPDPEFQNVTFVVKSTLSRNGRVRAVHDGDNPVYTRAGTAYLPQCVTNAKYLINMALLRPHSMYGVTLCAKNHFGSVRFPSVSSDNGWTPSPLHNHGGRGKSMDTYQCLVNLTGHKHLNGKTLLYMIDGLYGARNQSNNVLKYVSFGDDWSSSIFASQDPIAIDSVGLDFLRHEDGLNSAMTDVTGNPENYMHEAALADNPPSGIVYDPEGDGTRLTSLGVHEHWNNPVDKQYSRNLGTGEGIELVSPSFAVDDGPVENVTTGLKYEYIRHAVNEAAPGDHIVAAPGIYIENISFNGKNITLSSADPNDPNVVAATVIDGDNHAVTFAGGEDPNCVLAGFTIIDANAAVYCSDASPTITDCIITGNTGPGIEIQYGGNPAIMSCEITLNDGPGIQMRKHAAGRKVTYNYAAVTNCLIAENGQYGIQDGIVTITNCTIAANALCGISSYAPTVTNSIIYYNGSDGAQIESQSSAIVTYSDVQGGFPGDGNIDADPLFADPINGDFHLLAGSPCIDAGDPNSEFAFEPEPNGGRINMGAYGGTPQATLSQ